MELTGQRAQRLETIRALVAQAQSTPFEAEADVFMAKAQELMTRYQIDEYMVAAAQGASVCERPETRTIRVWGPHTKIRGNLLYAIALQNDCKCLTDSHDSIDRNAHNNHHAYTTKAFRLMWVTGFPSDLDNVAVLDTSLQLQMVVAMRRHEAADEIPLWINVQTWRKDFMVGFSHGVAERLRVAKTKAVDDAKTETGVDYLPVLRDRKKTVDQAYADKWSHGTRKMAAYYTKSRSAVALGTAAGLSANTGGAQLSVSRSALGSGS